MSDDANVINFTVRMHLPSHSKECALAAQEAALTFQEFLRDPVSTGGSINAVLTLYASHHECRTQLRKKTE